MLQHEILSRFDVSRFFFSPIIRLFAGLKYHERVESRLSGTDRKADTTKYLFFSSVYFKVHKKPKRGGTYGTFGPKFFTRISSRGEPYDFDELPYIGIPNIQ